MVSGPGWASQDFGDCCACVHFPVWLYGFLNGLLPQKKYRPLSRRVLHHHYNKKVYTNKPNKNGGTAAVACGRPSGGAGGIRTHDLQDMSLASYHCSTAHKTQCPTCFLKQPFHLAKIRQQKKTTCISKPTSTNKDVSNFPYGTPDNQPAPCQQCFHDVLSQSPGEHNLSAT